ncbi:MAG: 16S rRNA (guanine(966)-N(2))-methyltransferase RsmD [Alphaproteobacteria bacterium]
MRIIAGKHRHRRLAAPAGNNVRPTGDRVREAMFNILEHGLLDLDGAVVLDAFAGSGALGCEALSRGAAHVTFLEPAYDARAALTQNLRDLDETDNAEVLNRDATRPGAATRRHDLALFDPPYRQGKAEAALDALRDWLEPGAVCVVETDRRDGLPLPAGYELIQTRDYGRTRLWFVTAP